MCVHVVRASCELERCCELCFEGNKDGAGGREDEQNYISESVMNSL